MKAKSTGIRNAGSRKRDKKNMVMSALVWLYKACIVITPVNLPTKLLMTAAAVLFLSGAVKKGAEVKMEEHDVLVYSAIYCGWAVFFLPDVLLHLNAYMMGKLFWLFVRLFSVEVAVSLYLHFKGETDILHKGLSLRPMLGPLYQWLGEMAYSVRFALIVGCLSASFVANLFDRPEILIDFVEEDSDQEKYG